MTLYPNKVMFWASAKSLQSCLTLRPHRRQPTRLPRPWDSPGKNTGVGCHFLLQCMKVESESEVAQSCPTLSDPMDCSLPGSTVHGLLEDTDLRQGGEGNTIRPSTCTVAVSISIFWLWYYTIVLWDLMGETG